MKTCKGMPGIGLGSNPNRVRDSQQICNCLVGCLSNPILVYNFNKTELLPAIVESTIYPRPELESMAGFSFQVPAIEMYGV